MTRFERWLFALLVVLACVIVSRGATAMRGDAPHYLAATHSIVHDRDLDLSNQYEGSASVRFIPSDPTDLVKPGRTGGARILPDAWGFAAALVPAYEIAGAVASGLSDEFLARVRWDETRAARDLMSFAMALLYGWTAVLVFRLTGRIRGTAKSARLATTTAFATPPLLSMSFVVFPDVLAAFLVVLFVLAMTGDRPAGLGAALALACLPWLGAPYLVLTMAGLVWLVTSRSIDRSRRDVLLAAIPVVSVALLGLARVWTFGSLSPGSQSLNVATKALFK